MTTARVAAAAGAAALLAAPLFAQEQASAELAACLLDHSGPQQEEVMREFVVGALTDADRLTLQTMILRFGAMASEIGIRECGVSLIELQSDGVRRAGEEYAELLGRRIMEKALARLDLQ